MKVAVIMGSETDLKVMNKAHEILQKFGVTSHIEIVSAHRTPEKMYEFALSAKERGFSVIIAGAGAAAHLPGMVACLTPLPVIGVPIEVGTLKGIDALLSIAQMPRGIPVATVAINNGENAGLLAIRILALSSPKIAKKLDQFQKGQKKKVKDMNLRLKKSRRSR
ncbi:MAG: 5-(carboxyamino)imidazole ribonucleotide mutase [Bdellovibrio sp. CG10_big_fil_rev_8_21_14_0_10_47_8]|nr:MAG: 5-(carboxyamino)imidazole ribonucleotide mutase [Bdellovibrio sp. CG10_big_fil_rev_8_21_14_0_10_47_8]